MQVLKQIEALGNAKAAVLQVCCRMLTYADVC
jgi:hypothetical protein